MEFQTGGISKIWPEDKQHIICLCQKYGADCIMEIVKEYKKSCIPSLRDILLELSEQYEKNRVNKVEDTLSTDELISAVRYWKKYLCKSLVEGDSNSESI